MLKKLKPDDALKKYGNYHTNAQYEVTPKSPIADVIELLEAGKKRNKSYMLIELTK